MCGCTDVMFFQNPPYMASRQVLIMRIATVGTSFSPLTCQAWHGYGVTSAHCVEVEVGADGHASAPRSGAAAAAPPQTMLGADALTRISGDLPIKSRNGYIFSLRRREILSGLLWRIVGRFQYSLATVGVRKTRQNLMGSRQKFSFLQSRPPTAQARYPFTCRHYCSRRLPPTSVAFP
jgi:hypothetical protein